MTVKYQYSFVEFYFGGLAILTSPLIINTIKLIHIKGVKHVNIDHQKI